MKVLLAACVLVSCLAFGTAEQPDDKGKGVPESDWLTVKLLEEWIKELGYSIQSVQDDKVVAQLQPPAKNLIVAQFSDNDSVKLVTSWESDQTGLGDGPITNTWNNERRFCKVSINEKETGSVMVMDMDQLLPTIAGKDAAKATFKQAMDLFETGTLEFDQFSKETYRNWIKNRQEEKEDE
eukprot:TRINITY_DN2263_c0_g1_i1.p1 TRINITY_DN2263_c0_g1~~TRINITY_DN2263_c0_g1_i1.p1  ORF type:complete len:194 (+),score=45.84 TRINITY_DN2263_c0_g1_i1:42-584(+)